MTALIYIAAIIGWVVLSVFPGLYVATMALGAPGAPRSTVVRVPMHIIYAVVIGFIIELGMIVIIICLPFMLIGLSPSRVDKRPLNHLGYKITMDAETGDVYAYDPKTGHEVGRELNTRDYDEIITAIEQEYKNSNKTL